MNMSSTDHLEGCYLGNHPSATSGKEIYTRLVWVPMTLYG
jgi:hypothetical protein